MSYCCTNGNLNGWFDDLLQAGERVATSLTRQSPPAGYGTSGGTYGTPPMFPPTYGAPASTGYSQGTIIGASLQQLLPYILIGGVAWFLLKGKK
jgi:hypothetical protein